MSLVEDVLDLLRAVLDYFGVPPDMLVPVWDSQLCGQYRSLVRMIGTNLPLTPQPRIHFQVPLHTYRPHGYLDVTVDTPAIPSLADVLWLEEDEGDSFAKIRNRLPPVKRVTRSRDAARQPGPPALGRVQRGGASLGPKTEPEALRKITALEDELLKLRAQIAMIVTAAPAAGLVHHPHHAPGTPLMSPPPPPVLTSTPCRAPPPPPPPPPPLPPLCPDSSTKTWSALDLVRERREARKPHGRGKSPTPGRGGQPEPRDSGQTQGSEVKGIPSMLDVLKDLNQVKLRSVERSPGGTPVRKRRSRGTPSLSDPAALIAEALRRKFAHRRHDVSSDKENSAELSPFGSPETHQVPKHTRRSQGLLHL